MNTKGFGGRHLTKAITVLTDDPVKPKSRLTVTGDVELFATITPRVVRLNGKVGDTLKKTVKIVSESKYPFAIKKISAKNGEFIKYSFEEISSGTESKMESKTANKAYTVSIENLKKEAGSYYDVIILETDSKIQPEIKLNVMARIINPAASNASNAGSGSAVHPAKGTPVLKKTSGEQSGNSGKNFLEIIQGMQKQKNLNEQGTPAPAQDPEKAAELKKKFEELIRKAQEQKNKENTKKVE